ncbi:MAG: N-acetylglucosamine-6-phosphate deacetylase [Anaerolineae bacterium]|nr:N-acetylglucosamine-6-phosphate deacetylase [Anaerolineae bacterium]MCB9102645.1 N-acetylglucosamine-6-phosphate deacetylase [Anaerolineales bacterium]
MTTNQRLALTNGRIILPDRIVDGQALLIEAGRVVDRVEPDALGAEVETFDVGGQYIAPGLIDIHIHGAMGHIFNESTAEAFTAITQEVARHGITSLLATTMTAPIDNLVECLAFSREWLAQPRGGAQVLGVHVEGPYFSLAQSGAQDPANIRNPDDGTVEALLAYHDVIKIFTYAPELPGALDLTRRLKALGILAAAGHSSAKDSDVQAAMDAGLSHIIHIWSAQSSTIKEGPWRKPGLLEATLTFDGLTVEMITDNKHLPPTLMKLAYKCLGPDRLCAISDATSGAGLPEGSRFRMGEMEYDVHDGVGMMLDRSSFAGSTTLLSRMVPILIDVVGIPVVEAIRMVSLTPARIIGVADRKGSLEPGRDADLVLFDAHFTPQATMIGGEWV